MRSILPNNRPENIIEAVGLDLEHGGEILTQLSVGKSFSAEPLQIVNRQIGNIPALVLPKGHFGLNHPYQKGAVEHDVGTTFGHLEIS